MLRVSSTHAYQLGLAAVSKRQVAIDGHKAIARATKLEVLNLEYVSRDRRIPSTMSGYVGLGDCVRTVIVVEGGLVFFVSLVIACGIDVSPSNEERCACVFGIVMVSMAILAKMSKMLEGSQHEEKASVSFIATLFVVRTRNVFIHDHRGRDFTFIAPNACFSLLAAQFILIRLVV